MTPSTPLPRLLTIKEAAEALAVSRPMLYKLIRTGAVGVVQIGAACRIHPEDLDQFVAARRGRRKVAG